MEHGLWIIEDAGLYSERPSKNGFIYNDTSTAMRVLSIGDLIRIDDGVETMAEGVLFVFSAPEAGGEWKTLSLDGRPQVTIGRDSSCDIVLPHISVSKVHAHIILGQNGYTIIDNRSTNGVIVNGRLVSGQQALHEKDVISITDSKLIFTPAAISYRTPKNGISVDADGMVVTHGRGKKAFSTGAVDLNIRPGELVAIVGGSGAGKSTILNCLCGYHEPSSGTVYVNGCDLYRNFDSLKKTIGYVPQADIVYDNLTLEDMLAYTAKLRLPADVSREEREAAIERAIKLVELTEKKGSLIKRMSGGQKKRASIAVELISDPNLLFLDEPASGLDPGTERNLMLSLREMANGGKTVILVTHSTLQLALCDKIVFMGKGGRLCFFGTLDEALAFFGVSDVVDVYNMISSQPDQWAERFRRSRSRTSGTSVDGRPASTRTKKGLQLPTLCARYLKLVMNDRQRLLLLLVQAPLLAFLISLVADGDQFEVYDDTKSLLFALSCSAFWVGMLNAIQEVCKERPILKREYMAGLSLSAYILSKIVVLGIMCVAQSILIVSAFALTVGLPEEGILIAPFVEFFLTTFLTAIASASIGLFVSSLFTNADRAMTVAPILLMPQILFSGLIFKLEGPTELISWLATCRWSMEGYGTTANLNSLPSKLQQEGYMIEREAEDFFTFTSDHILQVWGILIVFVVGFLILSRVVLTTVSKDRS